MNKKAQVSVISFWILIILAVLAVSLGHRVSFGLKLSRYQKDRLKAAYLAKAGINRAIIELIDDKTPDYDGLNDSWADNEQVFKRIVFKKNKDEFASVSYFIKQGKEREAKYGLIDEERKININTASREALVALLEKFNLDGAADKADNILIWRGDIPDEREVYEHLGYPCKAYKFSSPEELVLVKGFTPEDCQRLRKLITIYTEGKLNINTASSEALAIVSRGIAKEHSLEESSADNVAQKIVELRNKKVYFQNKEDIAVELTGAEETNIFNSLMGEVVFTSNNFLIEVCGNVGKIKSKAKAVYNRKDKKILYWHES